MIVTLEINFATYTTPRTKGGFRGKLIVTLEINFATSIVIMFLSEFSQGSEVLWVGAKRRLTDPEFDRRELQPTLAYASVPGVPVTSKIYIYRVYIYELLQH